MPVMVGYTGGCSLWKTLYISGTFRRSVILLLMHLFNNAVLNPSAKEKGSHKNHNFIVYVFVTKV